MRTVFQMLMAAAAVMALTLAGCDAATPADHLRDHMAIVTVTDVEAREQAVVWESGAVTIEPTGTAVIALILDNSRKIPLTLELLVSTTSGGAGITWEMEQTGPEEVLVTIYGAVRNDALTLTLKIGADGRKFEPYAFTVLCTPSAFTVTFDTRGHGEVPPQTVASGSRLSYPEPPLYPGHYLEGWYRDSECTDRWKFANDTVNDDIPLYAKWAGPAAGNVLIR